MIEGWPVYCLCQPFMNTVAQEYLQTLRLFTLVSPLLTYLNLTMVTMYMKTLVLPV